MTLEQKFIILEKKNKNIKVKGWEEWEVGDVIHAFVDLNSKFVHGVGTCATYITLHNLAKDTKSHKPILTLNSVLDNNFEYLIIN